MRAVMDLRKRGDCEESEIKDVLTIESEYADITRPYHLASHHPRIPTTHQRTPLTRPQSDPILSRALRPMTMIAQPKRRNTESATRMAMRPRPPVVRKASTLVDALWSSCGESLEWVRRGCTRCGLVWFGLVWWEGNGKREVGLFVCCRDR
jgi:hypothetical protein